MPCVFCGAKKVSDEHVYPEWIRKELPHLFASRPADPRLGKHGTWRGEAGKEELISETPLEITARCVCVPCNTGWMADLEKLAEPILLNMMKGRKRTLFNTSQRLVATWAHKTGLMVREVITPRKAPERALFSPELYTHLYREAEPPRTVQVSLLRYSDGTVTTYSRSMLRWISVEDRHSVVRGTAVVYGQILLIGNLILVLTGHISTDAAWRSRFRIESPRNKAESVAIRIWPPPLTPRIDWPPDQSLSHADFLRLGNDMRALIDGLG